MSVDLRNIIRPHPKGFTLVELAVVLVIIGIIAAMGLAAVKAQMISAAIRTTQGNQDTIKSALIAYLGQHKRLPCPDRDFAAPDGIENRQNMPGGMPDTTSPCSLPSFGLIPYQTLGLPRSVALDGWDDFFSYSISNNTTTAPNQDWTISTNFHEGNTGAITVNDGIAPVPNFVAVVISYGKDGLGAYTIKGTQNVLPDPANQPNENQNATQAIPLTFYKREYTDNPKDPTNNPGGPFDDVVMVLGTNDLLNPLIKDGVIQSALGAYITQQGKIQDWVAGYIASHPCNPPPSIPTGTNFTVDPWGNTFLYSASFPFSASNAASAAYAVSSSSASAVPSTVQPSIANMIRIYPFLATLCP